MATPPNVLTTQRLKLRELLASDHGFVQSMIDDPEVMGYYPAALIKGGADPWLERQFNRYAAYGHGLWLVLRIDDNLPIGLAGLSRNKLNGKEEIELGYLFHQPYWGRGYATEAAAGCLKYGFEVLRATRIVALIRAVNLPSRAVAGRLGMTHQGYTEHYGLQHMIFVTKQAS